MIGQYRPRVATSLMLSTQAQPVTLAVLPPGWGFEAMLEELGSRQRVLILDIDGSLPSPWPGAVDVLVIDARHTNTEQLRRVVTAPPTGAIVVVLIDTPVVLDVPGVRVLGPAELALTRGDLDPSRTPAERSLLEQAIVISGGQPALYLQIAELLEERLIDRAAAVLNAPEADPRLRNVVESVWNLLDGDAQQLLSLIATMPGLISDDTVDLGVVDPDTAWQQCRASGLIDPRADDWALTPLAHAILEAQLKPRTETMRLDHLLTSGRHELVIRALVLHRRPQVTLRLLRTLWQETAFESIGYTQVRTLALALLDGLLPSARAEDRGWLLAARGRLRYLSGFLIGAVEDLNSAARLLTDAASVQLQMVRTLHALGRLEESQRIARQVSATDQRPWIRAQALSWDAIIEMLCGRLDSADILLERADQLAAASHDLHTLAALSIGRSMAAAARRQRALHSYHHRLAVGYAWATNDVPMVVRLLDNGARTAFNEARLDDGLASCNEARRLIEEHHLDFMLPDTLLIAAQIHRARGDLDQAIDLLNSSEFLTTTAGSTYVGLVLQARGLCHLLRGDLRQAREDLTQALPLCRATNPRAEAQSLLSLALVDLVEGQFTTAAARIARVSGFAPSIRPGHHAALQALVRRCQGDPDPLRSLPEGLNAAVEAHDTYSELLCRGVAAASSAPPDVAELEAVVARWQSLSIPISAAIWQLVLGRIRGGEEGAQLQDGAIADLQRHSAHGPLRVVDTFSQLLVTGTRPTHESRAPLRITLLGHFGVSRCDAEIATALGSRKARILLQLLAARHGSSLTRDRLKELLWPGSGPGRLPSVISELRAELDPGKDFPPAAFINTDGTSVWLEPRNVIVDTAEVLSCAARGRQAASRGNLAEMAAHYEEAAERCTGEVTAEIDCEETVGLQEVLQVTIGDVHRALARTARDQNRIGSEVSWWMRVLAGDPYDMSAHAGVIRALVRQGRRGVAIEAYQRYCQRMGEIGVTPDPRLDPQAGSIPPP